MPRPSFVRAVAGCLATFLLIAAWTVEPAAGQSPPPRPGPDSSAVQRFRLADAYLRAGQFDRAIALLEDLRTANPDTPVFYEKLKEGYENVKRFDDAVALVDERLAAQPAPALMSEKARLLYRAGDETTADSTWQQALALAPQQAVTYRTVYQSLMDARLFTQAIGVMEQGRTALEEPNAFQVEMAYLYSFTGQHERAIQEYVQMLADPEQGQRVGFVKRRLGRFLDSEEALQTSIAAVSRAVRETPLNRAYRELMAHLYLEAGDYRKAFDANRAIDRLEEENGRVLYGFAGRAADAGAYEVALDAYRLALERHPDASVTPEVQRAIGGLHERWAEALDEAGQAKKSRTQYEKALDAYETFLNDYPNHAAYPSALRAVGHLQQDVLADYDAAAETLQDVVRRYAQTQAADEAQFGLGQIALQRGQLEQARLTFSRLTDRLRSGDLAEQARYELALLDFYEGAFDAAIATAETITDNPESDAGNDSIALKVLIQTGTGPDSLNTPLRRYAEARLKQRQGQSAAALAVLDSLLAQHGQHGLADEARFLRAELLETQGQTEAAATAFGELPLVHPRSPLADRSLFAAARLQENALGDTEAALQTYLRLLEEFPSSLLADEARARIRALRDEGT